MQCQRIVFHDGGGRFGSFTGYYKQCQRSGAGELLALITEGRDTKALRYVCYQHRTEIIKRKGWGWSTPVSWYTKE